MRCNPRMLDILRATDVTRLSDRDIPLMFREVVERGWSVTASGGRVLTALRTEVPGIHSDRLAEETTVNGRGMTDYDLPTAPDERTPSSAEGVWRMRVLAFGGLGRSSATPM